MLAFPAKGGKDEAALQFKILNVWESYPDPALDIKAVTPMVWANQEKPSDTKGLAADLASKMKPPLKSDKYVSENFSLFGKLFTRWSWNKDVAKENFFKNSLEIGIDGKVFTDVLDFYLRFESAKWDRTVWYDWNNDTPSQIEIALQSSYFIFVKPLPTVDNITLGNYEVNYSPWVMGGAWYPDRDKYKGLFIDGAIEGLFSYKVAAFYPLKWLAIDGTRGGSAAFDLTYVAKVASKSLINGLDMAATAVIFTDYEVNPFKSNPSELILRGTAPGFEVNAEYKIPVKGLGLSVGGQFAYAKISLGDDFVMLENETSLDIDSNGVIGGLHGGNNNKDGETTGTAAIFNIKGNNVLNTGINFQVQLFNIDDDYCAPGAARGDTSFGAGGFGGSSTVGTADVLAMIGNQSAHRAPQAADFYSSVPIPQLPAEFVVPDPMTGTTPITWVNDNWEGIAALGWKGATAIIKYAASTWRAHAEFSVINFNADGGINLIQETTYDKLTKYRGYVAFNYSLMKVARGLTLTASFMYEKIKQDEMFLDVFTYVSGGSTYVSPHISAALQLSKIADVSLGFRYELATLDDGNKYSLEDGEFKRKRIILSFNLNTPLGFIKTTAEYWQEDESDRFTDRALSGAYAVTEWEVAF